MPRRLVLVAAVALALAAVPRLRKVGVLALGVAGLALLATAFGWLLSRKQAWAAAAARAAGAPPSGSKLSRPPTGASITGSASLRPKKSTEVSIFETSRRMRGRKASLSKP
jgi:hypothetical protein